MSGNPFRKGKIEQKEEQQYDTTPVDERPQTPPKARSTKKKRVVIKTPPRSPEEPPRRMSLGRTPSPPPPLDAAVEALNEDADADMATAADPGLKQAFINTKRNSGSDPIQSPPIPTATSGNQAPYNPFARTLASTEGRFITRDDQEKVETEPSREVSGNLGKPAMDVDTFKNILLNGVAPPSLSKNSFPTSPGAQKERVKSSSNSSNSSSTADSTSISRSPARNLGPSSSQPQVQYTHSDSVSPTHSSSSSDDEEGPLFLTEPQLQNLKYRGLISSPSSLQDSKDQQSTVFADPDTNGRGSSDLNKPLPPPPGNASFDDEDDDTSTEFSRNPNRRSIPPPPPVSRRQGYPNIVNPSRPRSSSNLSKSSLQSDSSTAQQITAVPSDPTLAARAPPPPPSRRSQPGQTPTSGQDISQSISSSHQAGQQDRPAMVPPPAPAPRRAPSKASPNGNASKRASSTASRSSLQALSENQATAAVPPRPPPRRTAGSNRSSVDGTGSLKRMSGHGSKRVSTDSQLEDSTLAQPPVENRSDMLADLAALQREVDELRAKAAAG